MTLSAHLAVSRRFVSHFLNAVQALNRTALLPRSAPPVSRPDLPARLAATRPAYASRLVACCSFSPTPTVPGARLHQLEGGCVLTHNWCRTSPCRGMERCVPWFPPCCDAACTPQGGRGGEASPPAVMLPTHHSCSPAACPPGDARPLLCPNWQPWLSRPPVFRVPQQSQACPEGAHRDTDR